MGKLGMMALAMLAGMAVSAPAEADEFYKGRQIRLVIGTGAGGSYNRVARLVARHLYRHIPGRPSIVPQNMQGASSIKAANYVYNVAPQDGSVMVAVVQTLPQNQLFRSRNVKYDAAKFQWIGNPSASAIAFAVWHTSPVRTLEDARHHEVICGAAGARGTDGYLPMVLNNLLGTKFKLVTGYKGNGVFLAMERGEVTCRGGLSWSGWRSLHPDWIRDKKVRFLTQFGLKRNMGPADVPLATELGRTDDQRRILRLFSMSTVLGYPLLVGPGVPAGRVAVLRTAFRATMSDPKFRAQAKTMRIEVAPVFGEDLQGLVNQLLSYPPDLAKKAKKAMKRK